MPTSIITPRRPPPPSTGKRKTATAPKKKKKKSTRLTVQEVSQRYPAAFRVSARCKADDTSASARVRKTPAGDPQRCLGLVRLGRDGKHLYIATQKWKKNPKIKYSTSPTGAGYHLAFSWKKLYNARTKKPFDVKNAPSGMSFLS